MARRLGEEFEGMLLEDLGAMHIQDYYTKQAKKWKPKTIRNYHRFLHQALSNAVRMSLIGRNVADLVTPPKVPRTEQDALTPKEARWLMEEVKDNKRLYLPTLLGLAMGMRLGEAYGLRWQDVNLDEGSLHIKQEIQRNSMGLEYPEPKSLRSKRHMMIPGPLVDILRQHKKEQAQQRKLMGDAYQDYDLINCQTNGRPWHPPDSSTMFKKAAAKALQKLEDQKPEEERGEIKKITFHNLRHTNVTLLMKANIHSLKISRWVGHADTQLVDKIYAHVHKDAQGEIVGQIERDLFAAQ